MGSLHKFAVVFHSTSMITYFLHLKAFGRCRAIMASKNLNYFVVRAVGELSS